jgi:cell wall-associated NlpC family hydrolase
LGAAFKLLTEVILPALSKKWDEDWQAISDKADTVWKFLDTFVFAPLGAAMDLLRGTWLPALKSDWDRLWSEISTKAGEIKEEITGFINTLQTNITNAWNTINTDITSIVNGIAAFLVQSWDNINRQAGEWWTMVKDTIWNSIKPLADLVQGMVNGIQTALNSIKVPNIPMPSVGGAASTAAAAAQTGFDWAKHNFEQNQQKAHEDNLKKQGKGAGGEIVGGDIAASGAGEKAIQWALSRLGQGGWVGWCQRFVENAFGTGGRYASAWSAANSLMTNPGGTLASAPRGTLVFFRPHPTNGGFGHVGLSLGGGQMVSATNNGPEITGMNSYWNSLFAGWGPPRFAKGVRGFGGGWAVVGEKGWELAQLPRGTNVYSHEESRQMVGAGGGGAAILVEVPISIDGEVIARVNRTYQSRFESRNRVGGVGGLQ